MKTFILSLLFGFIALYGVSQTYSNPNIGQTTHPTLRILKIEISGNQTIIRFSVKNEIDNGYFCADKNIYIKDSNGSEKYHLIKSKNIAVCPEAHHFRQIGETLEFTLFFPRIDTTIKYLDIVEDCNEYCFRIQGMILNNSLNSRINKGFDYYSLGKTTEAIESFKAIVKATPDYNFGIYFFYLIDFYARQNNIKQAKIWYQKLLQSNCRDKITLSEAIKARYYYL